MDKAIAEMHATYPPFEAMMKKNNIKFIMSLSAEKCLGISQAAEHA